MANSEFAILPKLGFSVDDVARMSRFSCAFLRRCSECEPHGGLYRSRMQRSGTRQEFRESPFRE